MKLIDPCWRLNPYSGIEKTTVTRCTRGDSTCDEFFATEREAWLADAERHRREKERHHAQAAASEQKELEARKKAAALGEPMGAQS